MTLSVLNAVGILDIRDFGAVGDTSEGNPPGTPCAAALQAAIRALDSQRGGDIYLPYAPSGYYFEAPVLVDRPVYIHGAGRSFVSPGTRIYAAPGVTPLIFVGPNETDLEIGGNSGATGFIIEKLNISSLGKNTNRENASFAFATPDRVVLAEVGDFAVNQVVRVGGAGQRQFYYRTKVDTHAGTNTIDGALSDVFGAGVPGLRVGMWIMVPGAHEHPVKVSAGEGGDKVGDGAGASFTVVNGDGTPANASTTLTGKGAQYCDDFYGRIMRIEPGNVLVLDTTAFVTLPQPDPNANPPVDRDHPNTEVTHASCGIYSRVFGTIRDVFTGHNNPEFDMEGCGVLLYGDHGSTPLSNLNGWRCEHLFTYGCQHGLKVLGTDANAGTNDQSLHVGARSWTIIDYSFLGNVHINPQMSGGTGIITTDNPPSRTVIIGAYNEGGTPSNFGVGTDWLGGTIASDPGGAGSGVGTWNKLFVGRIDLPTVFQCQTMMQPAGATNATGGITGFPNFLNFRMVGGSVGGLSLRKLESGDVGVTGGFAFVHESGNRAHPIVVVDVVGGWSEGSSLGDLVLGQGFWLGENMQNNVPRLPRASHWTGDVVDPVTLGLTGAQRFHVYSEPVPGGYVGWAGTASSDPNPWTTFGEIISNDILLLDVTQAGGPNYTLTDTQAAHRVIRAKGAPTSATSMVIKTPAVFNPTANAPQPDTICRIIHNQSGQLLTVKATDADPGIVVAPKQSSILWSDGINFFKPS
jgi:hypothetical protein